MAPPVKAPDASIDRSPAYQEFISSLAAYHAKRGTHFDPEPRVGSKHVDLLRLFNMVVARGGYDKVSAEKLAWRKLGQEFNLGHGNLPALAFSLKSTYYKNLAAYEISTIHGKEPPPKEILENISARGGDLLNRTLENYRPHGGRDQGHLVQGEDQDAEERKIPNEEKPDVEESGIGGRSTRGLRQAPPQRVLFQPDVTPARQARQASVNAATPNPTPQAAPAVSSAGHSAAQVPHAGLNYEPRTAMNFPLRPVSTPGNNPSIFEERARRAQESAAQHRSMTATDGIILPGTGFEGPNIYVRILMGLRSGIPEEQDHALYHLVKISHERGDKYKFDAFPGLLEGLMEKAYEIDKLFYAEDWSDFLKDVGPDPNPERRSKLQSLIRRLCKPDPTKVMEIRGNFESAELSHHMAKINEACLVLRNMIMLDENATYVSTYSPMRDFMAIVLNLPETGVVVEMKHYALEIAEQLTKFWSMDPDEPLYRALLSELLGEDRGMIVTGLRALSRISMNLEASNHLRGVSPVMAENVCNWLLLEDEELTHACLDFLYQYTAHLDNVETLVRHVAYQGMISQLARLLQHGAIESRVTRKSPEPQPEPEPPATGSKDADKAPGITIPEKLFEEIIGYNEPERSSHWLRACFIEDLASDISQVKIWQAYQARFGQSVPTEQLLGAAEFIKNVTATFPGATAQVLNPADKNSRFIIRGIKWRDEPMDPQMRIWRKCLWRVGDDKDAPQECNVFHLESADMWDHVVGDHLGAYRLETGKFDIKRSGEGPFKCCWDDCQRYHEDGGIKQAGLVGHHLKQHMWQGYKMGTPEALAAAAAAAAQQNQPPPPPLLTYYDSPVDERGEAGGLPLSAVLVMRNLVRNLPRIATPPHAPTDPYPDMTWVGKVFTPVMSQLWYSVSHNRTLGVFLSQVVFQIINAEPYGRLPSD